MSVHYKFKSSRESYTVTFDGLHISVGDLKKSIMQQKKIGKSAEMDLQITNAQTKEVYETDSSLIPKNTSVIVARVPVSGNAKKSWDRHDSSKTVNSPSHIDLDKITKSSNLSASHESEEEKIKTMMNQSTQEYDPSKYVKSRGMVGPLPPNYTCFRCGLPGHYIKQCPMNNMDIKRSTGIPRSFMIPASADQKGALLTASGEYAVPIIDHEAYKEVKKEKPPFLPNSEPDLVESAPEIPDELKCTLCHDLLQDAVLIHCCGNSYCDDCIRSYLLETENHECPTCHEIGVSPDTLIPNRYLRTAVTKFKNDTGYCRIKLYNNNNNNNDNNNGVPQETVDDELKLSQNETEIKTHNETEDKLNDDSESEESPLIQNGESDKTNEPLSHDDNDEPTMEEVLGLKESPNIDEEPIDEFKEELKDDVKYEQKTPEETELNENCNSQRETVSRSETPLTDEPQSQASETEQINEIQGIHEINEIPTLNQFQPVMSLANPKARIQGTVRPQRPNMNMSMGMVIGPPQSMIPTRPSILPHPRMGVIPRQGFHDARYFRPMPEHMRFQMGMPPVPSYYGPRPMGPPDRFNPYGYMGPQTHLQQGGLPHHPMVLHQNVTEAPPPGTIGMDTYQYGDYDDYEERLDKFTKQLEARPTRRRSRSRSRTPSRGRGRGRSSRSRSSSDWTSSSSRSRFSRSSSRSQSPNYRRVRSRSRSYHRRYSRSRSPRFRRDYRHRRSKSRSPVAHHASSRSNRKQKQQQQQHHHHHHHRHKKEVRPHESDKDRDKERTGDKERSRRDHDSDKRKNRDKERDEIRNEETNVMIQTQISVESEVKFDIGMDIGVDIGVDTVKVDSQMNSELNNEPIVEDKEYEHKNEERDDLTFDNQKVETFEERNENIGDFHIEPDNNKIDINDVDIYSDIKCNDNDEIIKEKTEDIRDELIFHVEEEDKNLDFDEDLEHYKDIVDDRYKKSDLINDPNYERVEYTMEENGKAKISKDNDKSRNKSRVVSPKHEKERNKRNDEHSDKSKRKDKEKHKLRDKEKLKRKDRDHREDEKKRMRDRDKSRDEEKRKDKDKDKNKKRDKDKYRDKKDADKEKQRDKERERNKKREKESKKEREKSESESEHRISEKDKNKSNDRKKFNEKVNVKDDKSIKVSNEQSNELPDQTRRAVKINRPNFTQRPTLSITIHNTENDETSQHHSSSHRKNSDNRHEHKSGTKRSSSGDRLSRNDKSSTKERNNKMDTTEVKSLTSNSSHRSKHKDRDEKHKSHKKKRSRSRSVESKRKK